MRSGRLSGKQSLSLRRAIWNKTNGKCCYCEQELLPIGEEPDAPNAFTVEHVVPIAEGGSNHFDNLWPCCRQCNNERGKNVRPLIERRPKRLSHKPFQHLAEVIDLSTILDEPDPCRE